MSDSSSSSASMSGLGETGREGGVEDFSGVGHGWARGDGVLEFRRVVVG